MHPAGNSSCKHILHQSSSCFWLPNHFSRRGWTNAPIPVAKLSVPEVSTCSVCAQWKPKLSSGADQWRQKGPASWTYPLEIKKLTPPNGLIWQFPVGASSSRADFLFRVSFQGVTQCHTFHHLVNMIHKAKTMC